MMLDATAGNRMLWPNKNPPNTVFLDKETRLRVPPDVFGCWERLPFRDDVFNSILFDPPHYAKFGPKSRHSDPRGQSWFGMFGTKTKLVRAMAKGIQEFTRVGKSDCRLCFKWCDTRIEYTEKTTGKWRRRTENPLLWSLLSLFYAWKEIHRLERLSPYGKYNQLTSWITFVPKITDFRFAPNSVADITNKEESK